MMAFATQLKVYHAYKTACIKNNFMKKISEFYEKCFSKLMHQNLIENTLIAYFNCKIRKKVLVINFYHLDHKEDHLEP